MSPTLRLQRRAQLLAELRELDRLEALERDRPSCASRAPVGAAAELQQHRGRPETIDILGATWEVRCGR